MHVLHIGTYQEGHGHESLETMKYQGTEKGGHDHEGPKTMEYCANEVHKQGKHRGHEQTEPGDIGSEPESLICSWVPKLVLMMIPKYRVHEA